MNALNIKLPRISLPLAVAIFAVLIVAALSAVVATPDLVEVSDTTDLEVSVPTEFGSWRMVPTGAVQVQLSTGEGTNMDQPYDQTVMRTYMNKNTGEYVQLALAWGRRQRQEVKVHRPDLCYVAQGYKIESIVPTTFDRLGATSSPVVGKRMFARTSRNGEAVAYWIRIGELYSEDALDTRLYILGEGIQGRIPDGILVRASRPVRDGEEASSTYPELEAFLTELTAAVPEEVRRYLIR
ncbi:MAG: EpsI family protein [Spirochaetia bacterium]|jgi:EpsI family protein|nr:EpsI family protein [Spirochaetia bacterium]